MNEVKVPKGVVGAQACVGALTACVIALAAACSGSNTAEPQDGSALALALAPTSAPTVVPTAVPTVVTPRPLVLSQASAACPATRWIAYHPAGRCIDPLTSPHGRWLTTHVFDPGAGIPASLSLPTGLGYYCSYDWESPTGHAPDLASLPKLDARSSIGPDCMAIAALAPSIADAPQVWEPLRNNAITQAGLRSLPPKLRNGFAARPVRVAVVDSAPSTPFNGQAGVEGTFAHGHNVGRVIRELSCPFDGAAGACLGSVSNHLALPLLDPTTEDRQNGGFFGRQSDLASAIASAVKPPASLTPTPSRTIVNLSVGWDSAPGFGGPYVASPAELSPPARAVHDALAHAACLNVLTFAAAGNKTYGDASVATQGAMYPAAWEAKRGPTASECVALEGPGYTPPPSVSGAPYPLVYAVGGLDGRDQPLENSRDHGRPRLNAYGFAVVSSNVGSGHTEPMTGTSMATAVASSAAAVLWAYKPDLTPREVALGLLASATPLTATPADLCFGPANCGVAARISVGGAYARAECGADAACASQLAPNLAAYAGKNPFWTTTDAWTTSIPGGVAQLGDVKACTDDASPACADPVSAAQTKEATPWVKPQPGAHGCDICGVGGSQLFVTLDPSIFQSTKLGYLTLYGVNGALVQYVVPVPAGAQTFSVGSVAPPPGGTTSAAISFKVNAPTGTFVTHEQIPTW